MLCRVDAHERLLDATSSHETRRISSTDQAIFSLSLNVVVLASTAIGWWLDGRMAVNYRYLSGIYIV